MRPLIKPHIRRHHGWWTVDAGRYRRAAYDYLLESEKRRFDRAVEFCIRLNSEQVKGKA